MSRLNFSPIDKAFTLGSSQIKDTQEEIATLTKLILDSNVQGKNIKKQAPEPVQDNYMRIGYPDSQTAFFEQGKYSQNVTNNTTHDNFDYNLLKVIGHPSFDDIVKNYAMIKHPEWFLKDTIYTKSNFGFGNKYQNTLCSEVRKILVFFVICIIIFLLLSIFI